jgi:dihydrofolate reductase
MCLNGLGGQGKLAKNKIKMPSATSVVARSWPDHVIGIENKLPWHLGTDLRHFRKRTEGHAIIMGRKTYESIGRPLPRRENIVLSRENIGSGVGIKWAQNVETALLLADIFSICNFKKQFFVIGGERIYEVFRNYINKVYLTEVFTRVNGDAKFDWEFPRDKWRYYKEREFSKSEIDDHPFRITTLVRLRPQHRYETTDRLMKADPHIAAFLDRYAEMIESAETHTVEEEQLSLL